LDVDPFLGIGLDRSQKEIIFAKSICFWDRGPLRGNGRRILYM